MPKTISIKLTRAGLNSGPFTIYDQFGNIIAENVSRKTLIEGINYIVDDDVIMIRIMSTGICTFEKSVMINDITQYDFFNIITDEITTGCLWKHLNNPEIYHTFYGRNEPYIIEYCFAYQYQDELLQNIKDYTKAYKYFADPYEVSNEPNKIHTDNVWFNKAIVYNGQQCSGILNLVPKPKHNLKAYNSYPIYRNNSKDIIFTKSDNFYQFNTFWDIVKDKTIPLFERKCDYLSVDKVINQSNMDYSIKSFHKSPIRAKDLRIRYILDNRSDAHLVSQIIFPFTQISYK